jgi:hypothetical protein
MKICDNDSYMCSYSDFKNRLNNMMVSEYDKTCGRRYWYVDSQTITNEHIPTWSIFLITFFSAAILALIFVVIKMR